LTFRLDYLVYRAGFAADTQAKEQFGPERYLEESYAHWAIGNAKSTLNFMMEQVFPEHHWRRIFIGGKGNYRDSIATTLPAVVKLDEGKTWTYKGNRNNLHKPKYFSEIREYLINEWGAEVTEGRESDDEVSIVQYSYPDKSTCIVGQDKDLDMCPGWHYNPIKKTFKYVTLKEANLFFRLQTLTGDWGSDYIPGLDGIGEVRAKKVLKDCNYDLKEIDKVTLQMYNSEYGPKLGQAVLNDNRNLLWIQRESWTGWNGNRIDCEWSRGDKGE
jgi:hypothetical protein